MDMVNTFLYDNSFIWPTTSRWSFLGTVLFVVTGSCTSIRYPFDWFKLSIQSHRLHRVYEYHIQIQICSYIYNTYNHILFKCKCVCEMDVFFLCVCISTNTHSHASNYINTHIWAICIYMYNYIYKIDYTYICTYTHIYTDTLTYTVHFHT